MLLVENENALDDFGITKGFYLYAGYNSFFCFITYQFRIVGFGIADIKRPKPF